MYVCVCMSVYVCVRVTVAIAGQHIRDIFHGTPPVCVGGLGLRGVCMGVVPVCECQYVRVCGSVCVYEYV